MEGWRTAVIIAPPNSVLDGFVITDINNASAFGLSKHSGISFPAGPSIRDSLSTVADMMAPEFMTFLEAFDADQIVIIADKKSLPGSEGRNVVAAHELIGHTLGYIRHNSPPKLGDVDVHGEERFVVMIERDFFRSYMEDPDNHFLVDDKKCIILLNSPRKDTMSPLVRHAIKIRDYMRIVVGAVIEVG